MGTAFRTGLIATNPMLRLQKKLSAEELIPDDDTDVDTDDIGEGLTEDLLRSLVAGFKQSSLYPVVALASSTGARRKELLALRWVDLDVEKRTLRIEWALEQTKRYGIRRKRPKTKRGWRIIDLADATVAMLVAERERHQRIQAGIPDSVTVDLSLIKLSKGCLMFPNPPDQGQRHRFHGAAQSAKLLKGIWPPRRGHWLRQHPVPRPAWHPHNAAFGC